MLVVSEVAVKYTSLGADRLIRDEERTDKAISKTAKNAEKNEKKTKRWMERHKTALTTIGLAAAGALAAVVAASPGLQAALNGVYLEFSMLAMDIGERWVPAFEMLEGVGQRLTEVWEGLPEPVKNFVSVGLLAMLGILMLSGTVAGLSFLLDPLIGLLGGAGLTGVLAKLPIPATVAGLSTLGFAVSAVAGLVAGGLVVWLMWKYGVIQAIEDAGAQFGLFAQNAITILGNLKDNIVEWFSLVAASAGLWGAQLALNWMEGITSKIPILGDILAPQINRLQATLDSAGTELLGRWEKWGLMEGLMEGVITKEPTPNRAVSDLIGEMDKWIFGSGEQPTPPGGTAWIGQTYQQPVPMPTQDRGGDVYLTIERGAVSVSGADATGFDERKLAELFGQMWQDELRRQGR
ncbi:hypothetical protein [Methanoculleus sp.]|uniref:hypothetical protein n=1 Tax=Methanoculleus sp. TaxID=90427 RepID=UPI001BD48B39|nr:hypothetical protein [Methanoculleus sp.]